MVTFSQMQQSRLDGAKTKLKAERTTNKQQAANQLLLANGSQQNMEMYFI